jgi:hypothetical protein
MDHAHRNVVAKTEDVRRSWMMRLARTEPLIGMHRSHGRVSKRETLTRVSKPVHQQYMNMTNAVIPAYIPR